MTNGKLYQCSIPVIPTTRRVLSEGENTCLTWIAPDQVLLFLGWKSIERPSFGKKIITEVWAHFLLKEQTRWILVSEFSPSNLPSDMTNEANYTIPYLVAVDN